MAFTFWDYKSQAFTNVPVVYKIGTAATRTFIAEEIIFYSDQDCNITFEDKLPPVFIPKQVYFQWYPKCGTMSIVRDTVNGTLKIWSLGYLENP